MSILWRYILRSFFSPFVFAMAVIIFLFMTNYFIKEIPQLLSKDVSVSIIVKLITLNMAWIVALAIPMSVLVATLMLFGRMSADNEITAMKASGYGMHKVMLPMLVLASIIAYGNYRFCDVVLPEWNHQARGLFTDINLKRPSLSFQEGIFSNEELIKTHRLKFKNIDHLSNWVYEVTILDYSDPNIFRTVVAEKATLDYNEGENQIVMVLYNGEMHDVKPQTLSEYGRSNFERYRIRIDVESTKLHRSTKDFRGDREKSIAMLQEDIEKRENDVNNYKQSILQKVRKSIGGNIVISPELESFLTNLTFDDFSEDPNRGFYINKYQDNPVIKEINNLTSLVNSIRSENVILLEEARKYINKLTVEIQKKYSIPAACIVFVLIGVPLGVRVRRGGLAVSGGLSVLFFLIHWICLIGGETLADRNIMSPWLSMWIADILVGAAGIWLTINMIRK